jgi:hypothetical protein
LDTSKKPPGLNPIGATVLLGIQVRLFGKRHNQGKYKDYDVDESEVD